jgi:tRNA threonylcarbamoyladenosine biosynthesis protein TsaE
MATFISHSPAETESFAQTIGTKVQSATVIGLVGDLGAGKTCFVKGLAEGLGVKERVLSPTFALLHIYRSGRLPLYHLDLYRLERPEQMIAAGLEEYLNPTGVTVVEWWDRWPSRAVAHLRQFHFETLGELHRRITYDDPCS